MGTRKYIRKHEETCPNIRVECSRCQTLVIRAKIYTHDCFASLQQKLEKVDKTLVYVKSRIQNQESAKKRFEYVL
jgi:ribosome-associated translation inhibitor RaiA